MDNTNQVFINDISNIYSKLFDEKKSKNVFKILKITEELNQRSIQISHDKVLSNLLETYIKNSKDDTSLSIKLSKKCFSKLVTHLEKDYSLIPKNYYQNQWMALGMALFGIPLGVLLYATTQNPGNIAIWIPIGMVIGIAIGAEKDKKAEKGGKLLNVDYL